MEKEVFDVWNGSSCAYLVDEYEGSFVERTSHIPGFPKKTAPLYEQTINLITVLHYYQVYGENSLV